MSSTETAVEAYCRECRRECFVTDEPTGCPYCGGDLDVGHGVVVRPH